MIILESSGNFSCAFCIAAIRVFPCRVLCIGMQVDCDFHNLLPLASWVGRDEPDVCCSFPLLDISIPSQGRNTRQNRWGMCVYTAYVYIWLWKLWFRTCHNIKGSPSTTARLLCHWVCSHAGIYRNWVPMYRLIWLFHFFPPIMTC